MGDVGRFELSFAFIYHRNVNIRVLLLRVHARVPVNNVGEREVVSDRLNVLDGALAKVAFENACDKVGHDNVPFTA